MCGMLIGRCGVLCGNVGATHKMVGWVTGVDQGGRKMLFAGVIYYAVYYVVYCE